MSNVVCTLPPQNKHNRTKENATAVGVITIEKRQRSTFSMTATEFVSNSACVHIVPLLFGFVFFALRNSLSLAAKLLSCDQAYCLSLCRSLKQQSDN